MSLLDKTDTLERLMRQHQRDGTTPEGKSPSDVALILREAQILKRDLRSCARRQRKKLEEKDLFLDEVFREVYELPWVLESAENSQCATQSLKEINLYDI